MDDHGEKAAESMRFKQRRKGLIDIGRNYVEG